VTVVVAGASPPAPPSAPQLAARVQDLVATGVARKEAIAEVATAIGAPKREVYQAVLDARG
ncbi:MAG: 16S rRNA (cytidine(1402)-2'-O)-methyltransferase, partial [Actinomycetota bacterium]|nr:16S rRNA (cytidine(1402)-2'-O)-methyltransferase [Actinomycetota bacterium]